jgi:hypothetical protein
MPDLTEHVTWWCMTNESYGPVSVESSSEEGKFYAVSWGPLYSASDSVFGPKCTCPGFLFRKKCKHTVIQLSTAHPWQSRGQGGKRCGWNATLEIVSIENPAEGVWPLCPECNGPARPVRIAT